MKWISSAGGPLVLLPSSIRSKWLGTVRAAECGASDYDRACSVRGYVGVISRYDQPVVVLNDEPLKTCVVRRRNDPLRFVRWVYAPSEHIVEQELSRMDLTGAVELEIIPSLKLAEGEYWLIDAGVSGSAPRDYDIVRLAPGDYCLRVVEHVPRDDTKLIVCELAARQAGR